MADQPLSYNAVLVLQAIAHGHGYGFDVMGLTGLPSGTVYPLLRRLEKAGLVRSGWEREDEAHADGRPRRRYYEATAAARPALSEALDRIRAQQALLRPGYAELRILSWAFDAR